MVSSSACALACTWGFRAMLRMKVVRVDTVCTLFNYLWQKKRMEWDGIRDLTVSAPPKYSDPAVHLAVNSSSAERDFSFLVSSSCRRLRR